MPISSELFSALEKGGGLAVEKTPSADKPAPQGGGSTFDRLLRQESGGRQTDKNGNVITSSKGAIGIAQVMPATGPEAAKLAGVEWDPVRFKSDAEYNKALGRAYFDKQLSVFGDERLALAAYNAGPGAVRLAIARSAKNGGDPLEYLPLETQKYVPAILGADAGVKPKGPKWADDKAIVRDDGRPGAIAKSDAARAGPTAGDMAKAFGASALSGVGDMGRGLIGEALAWLANKAAGTEEFEGQNLLAGVAESIRDDMTEGGKIARQDVPSGDVFQPETWKLPETTGGMLMIGADGLGSLVPSILPFVGQASKAANLAKAAQAAKVAGDFEKASQLAIQAERASRVAKGAGAVGGFAMTGGAAAGEVRQNIERELQGKSHEELLQNVPLYREAFDKTGDARMARQAVANGAAQYATLFAGAMGAVGGGINAKLLEDVIVKRGLSAALGKMSGNAAVRAGVGAGAGAVGEGLQEVSEKMGQNAGENVGMGRPIADNVTRDSFGDFIGGAMIGGPMGGVGGGASLQVKQPVQPVIKQNSPLSNMASVGQAAQANAEQDGAAVPGVNTPAQDPTADRLAAMQSFVEDKAFIQALRGTEGYGPESVTELLSAYAKARNPNIDPRLREMALSDLEKFVETFNNRPNFVFGKNTQEPTPQPGQSVAPYQQQGGAVGPTIRRPDGRTLDGEIITRPEGMAGANPNQLKAPPVLGLPTEEALQAKRQADADYEQAYQDLVKAEQLGANEAEIADYQRALLEAERLRDELAAQLADSDARVADSQQREAEARRRDILGSVIERGISGVNPVADVAGRFSAELMRQGYRDTAPTDAETQSILRAVDVANAREDGPLPSLPNEGDFYAPPKAQRTAPPKAESKPKQQPNRRLTPKEIREYVAAGAILNGDTLTLPDGTVLKLKGPQIAAAREAMRKVAPAQVETAPDQANETEVSPQDSAPQQVESPAAVSENPAETPDVSTRTDDQLRYLASNGKPGWKEAAQAEMARREGAKPEIRSDLDAAAHEAATSPLNDTPQPTDGQKSAGNYKVGRVRVQGMDISIENPKGSVRSGTSPDGRKWESTLHAHYGYFTGTKAADGDHLDVYLTDGAEDAPMVWVIDQKNADGTFDEHKTLLGPRAEEEAKAAYLANYEPGWDGIGAISSMPIEAFKAWAFDGKKKRKPLVYVEPDGGALKADEVARIIHESIAENAIKNSVKYNEEGVSKGRVSREVADASMERTRQDLAKSPINDRTVRLAKAIVDKEPRILVGAWAKEGQGTYGNEGSMNAFEKITGVKLRRLNSAQRAKAIFDWAGWSEEQVAEDVSRRRAEQEELKAQRQEKDDKATADQAERAQIKIRETGEVKTVREYIDGLIADGYTEIRTAKRGAVTKTVLANAEGWGRYLSSGIVKEYAVVASRRALDAKASGQSNPDTTTGDEEAEAPATAQPDPREAYADQKERAYVAKRGGVVPPKAAMAVRIGAYREYDRNQAAQPTHQDPGQPSEPVTPAVVAKSIQKSARNTEFNPAEAKKWLLGEIDKAVANVPAENTELAAELAREKAKTFDPQGRSSAEQKEFYAVRDSNIAKIVKQIGFVTFDVPGDGKFKVLNTVDGLNAFRSKVEKSSGFKAPANKPPVMERETDTGSYTPRDALADGEFLNAYELARLQGKPLRFSVGSGRPNAYTDASDVKGLIPGFKTFVGRKADSSKMPWAVIEESTGLAIGDGGTSKAAAIAAAKAKMKGHEQAIADKLKRGGISDAKLQDQLEADWIKWAEEREGRKLEEAEDDVPSVANFKTAKLLDAWLAENVSDPYQLETETPDGTLKDQGVGHLTLEKKTRLVHRVTKSQMVNDDDVSNVFKLKDGRLVWWNDATGDVLPVSPIDPRYSTNERYSKFIGRYMAERAEPAAKPMPNPLNMTPKQYFEARMQWIADDYGMSLPEVRESYDNAGFRDETDSDWIKAVRQAFKDGTELTRATLDKLEELRPGAFLSNLHDYPDANVPDGYQTPSARKAEKEAADAKRETRSEVAQPSDLANIFAGLSARGLAKSRAKKAAEAHPQAEQIAYVQENFHDILLKLMESGKLEVNGAKTVTEDNKQCL